MYVYYLTAMMCVTNVPAECTVVWERGPIKSAQVCQTQARHTKRDPQWNKLTCWFRPVHRT